MDEIENVLRTEYDFNQVNSIKDVEEGIMNESFFFNDENGDTYFVKNYSFYPEEKIKKSYRVMEKIKPEIKTNTIVRNLQGDRLCVSEGLKIEVSEFIDDASTVDDLSNIDKEVVEEMAETQAIFHSKVEDLNLDLEFQNILEFESFKPVLDDIESKISSKSETTDFDEKALEVISIKKDQIERYRHLSQNEKVEDLPTQINHGDFLPNNCFFDRGKEMKYLIDFEHIANSYRIYDIVHSSLCVSKEQDFEIPNSGDYDLEKFCDFIESYDRQNSLKDEELEYLPQAVLSMSIGSDLVLYGFYIAGNEAVKSKMPEDIEAYRWWENNYEQLEEKIQSRFKDRDLDFPDLEPSNY